MRKPIPTPRPPVRSFSRTFSRGSGPRSIAVAGTCLPLAGLSFPGARTVLSVPEIARKLNVCKQHVLDLIAQGRIGAIDVGVGRRRGYYRVPIEAWEKFLRESQI